MKMTNEELIQIQKSSLNNKDKLDFPKVGCFYCLNIFSPKEIKEWTDKKTTAICPHCHVDAVIGHKKLSKKLLKDLYNKFFKKKRLTKKDKAIISFLKEKDLNLTIKNLKTLGVTTYLVVKNNNGEIHHYF